ncbi:MAG: TlpA family protein disulfide reductase [Planctomycetota bacterium]
MNRILTTLALLALGAWLPAQAGGDAAAAAKAAYDALVAEWTAEQAAARAATKQVTESAEYKAARDAKDHDKARALMAQAKRADAKAFGQRALALADAHGPHGGRFAAYAATALVGAKVVAAAAAERLERRFLADPAMLTVLESPMGLFSALGTEPAKALLGKVEAKNGDGMASAWAKYWRAILLQRGKPTDEQKAEAEGLLAAAEKLAAGTELADRIAAPRFQKERLQVGMAIPDIRGEDMDGVPFALSDYRGKVVVLDFWGFW